MNIHNFPLKQIASTVSGLALYLSLSFAPAQAITTPGIVTGTATAFPSCLSYQVEGVCFFLRCKLVACWIETSIKISHYNPDVVVSTYNDPLRHPWVDIGNIVSKTMSTAGSSILGKVLDSSGGGLETSSAFTNYKSADAIGNPAGMLANMVAGGNAIMPSSLPIPGIKELSKFPSQELPEIGRQWVSVPQEIANTVASDAKKTLQAPMELLSSVQTILKSVQGIGQIIEVAETVQEISSGVEAFQKAASIVGVGGGSMFFCPGGASLAVHYQSDLDSPFWRGYIPVEMLYPQSWIPGLGEVGNGFTQTWGPTYPRSGEVIQTHPVKASAVLSERVASIIYKSAQPHIYTKVEPSSSGYKYFSNQTFKWQMLHPKVESGCVNFGSNDAIALTTFGDGKTDSGDGYSWNLWKKYICCKKKGIFLFSVP